MGFCMLVQAECITGIHGGVWQRSDRASEAIK
jgi:hypothetical protein